MTAHNLLSRRQAVGEQLPSISQSKKPPWEAPRGCLRGLQQKELCADGWYEKEQLVKKERGIFGCRNSQSDGT